jgi:hypothetical protein
MNAELCDERFPVMACFVLAGPSAHDDVGALG